MLAVTAMLSVQLGSAWSVPAMSRVGPAGVAWLRLTWGALAFVALGRPRLRTVPARDLRLAVVLGIAVGLQTTLFLAAIERIPLGTSVAVEFLGPLGVAAARGRGGASPSWPLLALSGVALLSEPWRGGANLPGLAFAAGAAVGWALYIVLTQRVGDRFTGLSGLALTTPIAAITAAVVGIPQSAGHLTARVVVVTAGLALLLPIIPYAFELAALRRMTHHAFGTLMALEPGFGVLLGLAVLHQRPAAIQVGGMALVITAGAAAQRHGTRGAGVTVPPGPVDAPTRVDRDSRFG